VRVYRAVGGGARLWLDVDESETPRHDPRDYDVDHYLRLLRETFAARLARALTPENFAAIVADPEQPSLFEPSLEHERPVLTLLAPPAT
jgi:hypothetical protein